MVAATTPAPNMVLRDRRKSLGLTQAEMAAAYGVALRTYQNWESGRTQMPRSSSLTRLYQVSGKIGPEEHGFHARPLSPITAPPASQFAATVRAVLQGHLPAFLKVPPPLVPRRVGTLELDRIRTRTRLLTGMYDQWGGGAVTEAALVATMRQAIGQLQARFVSDDTRSKVSAAAAELSLAVAAMLDDQANYQDGQAALLISLAATRDAGPTQALLRGRVLAQVARHCLNLRDVQAAHSVLDIVDSMAESRRLPADLVGLLTALRAGATGTLGQGRTTRDLATKARDLHASASSAVIPSEQVTYEAGFGLACLELCAGLDVDHATTVLEDALAAFPASQVRQRTHARTFRLLTMTERGDGAVAMRDIPGLSSDIDALQSAQVRESLALTHLVPRVIRGEPDATRVSAALHAYPAPVPPEFLKSRPSPTEVAARLHVG